MAEPASSVLLCDHCGIALSPRLLTCPGCHRLLHADALKRLAHDAQAAEGRGALGDALQSWRSALELLPPESTQHAQVTATVQALSARVDATGVADARVDAGQKATGSKRGIAGVLAAAAIFLATKGKVLLLGLTKTSTVFSMLLSLGVYWQLWGWQLAVGVVLSIYVHEMGHVVALRRFGIAASAPMFLPGFGAVVRAKQAPVDAREDARIGLAGPIWGTGAAMATLGLGLATGWQILGAIAHIAAWINLFNLLPVWSLDGARGFRALSRVQRWLAVAALAGAWALTHDGLVILLLLVAGWRAFAPDAPARGDARAALEYCGLVVLLSVLVWGVPRWMGLPSASVAG